MTVIGVIALMVIRLALLSIAGRQLLDALDWPASEARTRRIRFLAVIVVGTTIHL